MRPMTDRQQQVLTFIGDFTEEHGYAPSLEEIANHLGLRSVSGIHQHIDALIRGGYVRRDPQRPRSLEIVHTTRDAQTLPLLGRVAAGEPIEAIEGREDFDVCPEMLRRGDYVLQVRGDSMIEEQIRDGDYIIVRAQETARNGQVVVALVDGTAATVKRFFRERRGRVRLQPANPNLEPLVLPAEQVVIRGVVTGVVRPL